MFTIEFKLVGSAPEKSYCLYIVIRVPSGFNSLITVYGCECCSPRGYLKKRQTVCVMEHISTLLTIDALFM